MMLIHLVSNLILSLSLAADPANVSVAPPHELVAFVGEFKSIRELPDPCDSGDNPAVAGTQNKPKKICLTRDGLFEAEYEVVDVAYGNPHATSIKLHISDHNGFPPFARYKNALLFVNLTVDGAYLEKYQGFEVQRTSDGSWGECAGGIHRTDLPESKISAIRFLPDIVFGAVGALNARSFAQEYDPKYFEIVDGLAYCRKGVTLKNLFEIARDGVLKARGIVLDDQLRK